MTKHYLPFLLIQFLAACTQVNDDSINLDKAVALVELENTTLLATTIADDLDVPWEITVGPDNWIWYTEQKGTISRVHIKTGEKQLLKKIEDVHYKKSRGLLSMTLHPQFESQPYVYAHYTYALENPDLTLNIESRLVRYTFQEDTLVEKVILLDQIPGKSYHNGSRIVISPDLKLFLACGDAGGASLAQDVSVLNGKILRLNLDGSIPEDNPIPNSPIWSWGHRNVQGLTWANGMLYASEHGTNKDDEINIIKKGGNYGWNRVEGFCDLPGEQSYCQDSSIIEPLKSWTPTLGTAGLDYLQNDKIPEWNHGLVSANLKGRALRILTLNEQGDQITDERIYFQKHFGRIRDVAIDGEGNIYFSTSNTDWHTRHQPWMYDALPGGGDRIIQLSPVSKDFATKEKNTLAIPVLQQDLAPLELPDENWSVDVTEEALAEGEQLYLIHCATCHRPDGKGTEGSIPTLAGTDWVTGNRFRLINILLNGLSSPIVVDGVTYEEEMPAYNILEDKQIAAIINYIRTSFGNQAGNVTVAEVAEERKSQPAN